MDEWHWPNHPDFAILRLCLVHVGWIESPFFVTNVGRLEVSPTPLGAGWIHASFNASCFRGKLIREKKSARRNVGTSKFSSNRSSEFWVRQFVEEVNPPFLWSAALLVEAVNLRCALWVHSKTVQRENTKSAHACGACNLCIADRAISSSSSITVTHSHHLRICTS